MIGLITILGQLSLPFVITSKDNYKARTAGGDRDDVEADGILKPHLQRIVNQSMVLAQTAKDPAPYFTLLRLLFRAIGEHL